MLARIRIEGEPPEWFQLLDDWAWRPALTGHLVASVALHVGLLWLFAVALSSLHLKRQAAQDEAALQVLRLKLPASIVYFRPVRRPADAMPKLPVPVARRQQTLIQPVPVQREVAVAVPDIVAWSPPVPTPREFVAPAAPTPAVRRDRMLPDLSVNPATIQLSTKSMPSPTMPKLPTSGRPPVILQQSEIEVAPSANLSSFRGAGDPLALVALNAAALPPRSNIDVPQTVQQAAGPEGKGAGTAPGTGTAPVPPPPQPPPLAVPPKPLEILHPDGRVFDAVVVRSEPADERDRGILTSQPIYSAYLDVGTPRHWLMEYCAAGEAIKRSGAVITLPNPVKLSAPFPRRTIVPPLSQWNNPTATVIKGVLSKTGQLRDLALVRGEKLFAQLMLPFLAQWEFRPASRGGQAAEVEILLSIPAGH